MPRRCEVCDSTEGEIITDPWGKEHPDLGCSECDDPEGAYERQLEDYYGGDGPLSLEEQQRIARRLK